MMISGSVCALALNQARERLTAEMKLFPILPKPGSLAHTHPQPSP